VKVLVVDDAPEVVDSVRLGFLVQWREVDVLAAGTGKEALDLVEHESPDLVLLDVGLPDMDGFKVLQEIRFFSDVPVIMLTARDDTMHHRQGQGPRARRR
jgi:two-component system KDP operon response regulator KdpE